MRVPLSWLKEFVDITLPVDELAERLTLAGLEVKSIERIGDWWDRERILVGQILAVEPHPNADRLTLPVVDYGGPEPIQVVTGAPNVRVGDRGQKVVLALEGATLIDGHADDGRRFTLKASKIRGVRSAGMVCSEKELGLSDDHEGILILPEDAPVGTPLCEYLGDIVLELDLTPNLARCFCVIGVAREVAALTGAALRLSQPLMRAQGYPASQQVTVRIQDPDLCARYCAVIVRNVQVGPSPFWMQRRLRLAGLRPINNVVDITNYVMLEWGQPLHAFDYDLLHGPSGGRPPAERPAIVVRRAKRGERITTLDGEERELDEDILVIADGAGPVAVAGIMGGLSSEIGPQTRNVLIEAASFDMIGNRIASQKLRLSSEASARFGRGVPPVLAPLAAQRAAELMRTLAGGVIQQGIVEDYPVRQQQLTLTLRPARARAVLGLELGEEEMERILEALGFTVHRTDGTWLVDVPQTRLDVSIEEDLYEELVRIYGYDRLPGTLMRDELPPQHDDRSLRGEELVRDVLVTCGLQEVITYSLQDYRLHLPFAAPGALGEGDFVRVLNPLAADRQWLRRSLLPGLLLAARDNLRHHELVRLFEVGRVFLPVPGEKLPAEPARLGFVIAGPREPTSWREREPRESDFFVAKGIVEELAARLGVPIAYRAVERPGMHPGRTAALLLPSGEELGVLAEIHPQVRQTFDLPPVRVALCELALDALLAHWQEHRAVVSPSRFPAVYQDIAMILPVEVPEASVEQEIWQAGRPLLVGVKLFDVYSGEPIPAGHRNLAFRLTYQAPDRTLTEEEVRAVHERIARALVKKLGARVRQ